MFPCFCLESFLFHLSPTVINKLWRACLEAVEFFLDLYYQIDILDDLVFLLVLNRHLELVEDLLSL